MLRKNGFHFLFALLVTVVALRLDAAVAISPAAFTLAAGQSLNLTIAGASAQGVVWKLTPALGILTGSTSSAIYHAPSSVSSGQTVQVLATTVSTPSTTVKAVITLIPAITLAMTPTSANFLTATQQSFKATVVGSQNTAVTWTTSTGTISSSGLYTAPTTIAVNTNATVTATSQANPARSATGTVILHPKGNVKFTTQANGLQSVLFNGVNYNYIYGEQLVTSVTPSGLGTIATICKSTFTATTVSEHCPTSGADSVDATVTFTTPAPPTSVSTAPGTITGTIRADVQVTNNSATTPVAQALLSILGVSMAQYNTAASHALSLDATNPVNYVNYGAGQFAIWNNAPSPDVSVNVTCAWSYICKHQPMISNIAPGQTKNVSLTLRFTNDTTATSINLAPEAYTDFNAAYPSVVNWPDRRPIMAWFVADHSHQSATNPRGYLNDPLMDVSNTSAFASRILNTAQSILSQIKSRPIQPQGIIIWDLEGEEFIQPTTYIGDPRVLGQGYSPEMDAAADSVFSLFTNAGLKVGLTLRPQYLNWGATLPATCNANADRNYTDYYVLVNQPWQQKFYGCYSTNGVPSWSLIPNANGFQTTYAPNQVAQVTALLMAKVAYAHARWGTTLYYVDSSVWEGGAPLPQDVFRALQLAYPDCLFIPEENYAATMGVAMPYAEPNNTNGAKFSPVSWRYIYPTGGLGIYLSNCVGITSCWNNNVGNFDIGQKIGDIAIYAAPTQMSPAQYSNIEAMITQARIEAGSVTVTDSSSGAHFSYNGSPTTVYNYPLKMRVYFAATPATIATSTTYCENGGWTGTNACTLNLAGLLTAQIRYYDFNDQLISAGTAGPR